MQTEKKNMSKLADENERKGTDRNEKNTLVYFVYFIFFIAHRWDFSYFPKRKTRKKI